MSLNINTNLYNGPFDLLLKLIDKNKIDIYDVNLSNITEEFLFEVNALEEKNINVIAEFVYLASTLLEIKSKKLLPSNEYMNSDDDITEESLIEKLIEYKKFKKLSYELKNLQSHAQLSIFKYQEDLLLYIDDSEDNEIVGDQELLLEEILKVIKKINIRENNLTKFKTIESEEYSIDKYMIKIEKKLTKYKKIEFLNLINENSSNQEIIIVFLSLLELLKNRVIRVFQNDIFSKIIIELR